MHLSCMRINILPSVALQENGLDSDTLVLRPRLCARPEGPVRAGWRAAERLQEFSRPCLSCSTKSQSSIHKKVFYGPFWEKMSFVDMQSSSYFLVTKLFKIPKIKLLSNLVIQTDAECTTQHVWFHLQGGDFRAPRKVRSEHWCQGCAGLGNGPVQTSEIFISVATIQFIYLLNISFVPI